MSPWTGTSAWACGLLDEHLSEAEFLYSHIHRQRLDEDNAVSRTADSERRLVAHLDALALGGPAACQRAAALCDDGAPGHWYAAAMLACVHQRPTDFAALARQAGDSGHAGLALAVADALRHALPSGWQQPLLDLLQQVQEPMLGELADVLALMNLPGLDLLATRLSQLPGVPSLALVQALARARVLAAQPWLLATAQGDGPPVLRQACLLALAQLGHAGLPALAAALHAQAEVSHLVLGLTGGRESVRLLLAEWDRQPHVDTALALGLLGELSAVHPLVARLDDDELGAAAAQALDWITGAALLQTVPDPDDQAPALAGYQRYRPGRRLQAPAPRPVRSITRVSRDANQWRQWLQQAAAQFTAGHRYRLGQQCSALSLTRSLGKLQHTSRYRALASLELAIRHQPPWALDTRASLGRQSFTVQQLEGWAQRAEAPANTGRWWYAGRLL